MHYRGPTPADLANVFSLNLACLELLPHLPPEREESGQALETRLAALGPRERRRIAACPFLLCSLAEYDEPRWKHLFGETAQPDLLTTTRTPPHRVTELAAAALGFLWQLSKENPYAARLVSGAPLAWCEKLASATLVDLFRRVCDESSLIDLRMKGNVALWRKLLIAGTSDDPAVRRAARLSALQTLLTSFPGDAYVRLPSAARAMPRPKLKVAEQET